MSVYCNMFFFLIIAQQRFQPVKIWLHTGWIFRLKTSPLKISPAGYAMKTSATLCDRLAHVEHCVQSRTPKNEMLLQKIRKESAIRWSMDADFCKGPPLPRRRGSFHCKNGTHHCKRRTSYSSSCSFQPQVQLRIQTVGHTGTDECSWLCSGTSS